MLSGLRQPRFASCRWLGCSGVCLSLGVHLITPSTGIDWESSPQNNMPSMQLTLGQQNILTWDSTPKNATHSSSFDELFKAQSGPVGGTLDAREFTLLKSAP